MKRPAIPTGSLSAADQVWLIERAQELRLQGLTRDGAARLALEELARRRPEAPPLTTPKVEILPALTPGLCPLCGLPCWATRPLCRRHWAMVPQPLAAAVLRYAAAEGKAYQEAVAAAVRSVKNKEAGL